MALGVVGLSSVGLALQRTHIEAVPEEGLEVLSSAEYAILSAVAARLCPAPGPGVAAPESVDVALLADRLFVRADEDAQKGLKMALAIVESGLVGAIALERVRPFTQLSPEGQARALEWLRQSRIPLRRTIYRSLSGLVGSLYYSDPAVWPTVGYPGPPSPKALRVAYASQLVDLEALRGKPTEGEPR